MLIHVLCLHQIMKYIKKEKHFLIGMQKCDVKQFVFLAGSKKQDE